MNSASSGLREQWQISNGVKEPERIAAARGRPDISLELFRTTILGAVELFNTE